MYTVDDDIINQVEDDDVIEKKSWNNGTGLIVKIIIIILCVIVLIWLIKELNSNSGKKVDGATHDANVLKVRLAAEEYFFLKNKKDVYSVANIKELKSYGLVDDVVDSNGKVCDGTNSKTTLTKEDNNYKMTISLDCSTNDKDEVFYYHLSTLVCQNCNGKTIMNGQTVVVDNNEVKEENGEEVIDNGNNDIPDDTIEQSEYSCVAWSDWQENRVVDSILEERSKTLVQGVKHGTLSTRVEYGEWSDYTTTPLYKDANTEVESKVETVNNWSETKTAYELDTSNPNIKVVDTTVENYGGVYTCPNGYSLSGNTCVSGTLYGNLTYSEYNSGRYNVTNGLCNGVRNIKNSNGKYEITYLNCSYYTTTSPSYSSSTRTLYTYQELTSSEVTYYRSRTVKVISTSSDDVYTTEKYEEKDLPAGYVKVPGTEETFYSYKLTSCEK